MSGPQGTDARARTRIALIGPVLPFRGGIAQHTTLLYRALSARADVTALSFSRQYPRWLFPGESDRDPSHEGRLEPGVAYTIDSLNPLTWRDAVRRIRGAAPHGLVLPWWSVYWTFCFHHIATAARDAGIPVVFLCHNVVDHENAAWKRGLANWVLGTTDRFVVHHEEGRRQLLKAFPGATVRVHPHPTHVVFPEARDTLARRAALELLFFGFVRPYKGLDVLIDAMALLRDHDIRLTVAGEFWSDVELWRARIASLGLQERVELLPRYHSDEEVAELFARADAVVLPYRSATGSAVIPLAYRYGKPVIASNVGGLVDVVHPGETGLLVEAASAAELANAITSMSAPRAAAMRPAIEALAASLTWEGLASSVLEALGVER